MNATNPKSDSSMNVLNPKPESSTNALNPKPKSSKNTLKPKTYLMFQNVSIKRFKLKRFTSHNVTKTMYDSLLQNFLKFKTTL